MSLAETGLKLGPKDPSKIHTELTDEPICNVVGCCDDNEPDLGYTTFDTRAECLQMCKDNPDCTWYSYSIETECVIFRVTRNYFSIFKQRL